MKVLFLALTILLAFSPQIHADPQQTGMLNQIRSGGGQAPVTYSATLEKAALALARDMAASGSFSHTGSDGSDVAARVSRAGYGWCLVAENIAKGQTDLSEAMQAWEESPGHRANMMSPDVTEFAMARAYGDIWVMVLAKPGC